jgi:hypothetical protein
MSLCDFYLMTENEQIEVLYRDAVYVGKRKNEGLVAILFQLDTFYVEINYKKYRYFVESMQVFTTTEILEPYMEQINVDSVMKVEDLR